ncbi:hypothetical protein [Marivirga arenosa]|uniref:Uncharacterized protein n=1 Tax=Marivirga arenosa TaxID=3059076 RepID=A0AA49GH83_9BACT|nr:MULTISPECIES: hypothetical protein [unclassified Marivirga]WKK81522.2 hypothetical protein QYS47_04265 [Marivirga sp. BKB1-2]WKK83476.1 hypothetical protein QYS48_14160 [Marivirga sp. ABR2-2]
MEKSKKIGRNLLLTLGVIVGILIFLLGSKFNSNFGHAQKEFDKKEHVIDSNPIVKKFFS